MTKQVVRDLAKARAEIVKRGWCQHALQDHGHVCVIGAVNVAVHLSPYHPGWGSREARRAARAVGALAATIGKFGYSSVSNHNNMHNMTKRRVLAWFSRAIKAAETPSVAAG